MNDYEYIESRMNKAESQRDQLRQQVAKLEAELREKVQELAAIETGIRNEFTIGEPSGDVLQDFTTFVEHHDKVEAELAGYREAVQHDRKPEREQELMELAGQVEHWSEHLIGGAGRKDLVEAARQLRLMASDYTLKVKFVPMSLALEKCREFAQHKPLCEHNDSESPMCTCGFEQGIAAIDTVLKP